MPQDKEYLLKEQTAEATYQKKLTAGANITISTNNVISAVNTPATTVSIIPTYNTGTVLSTVNINGNNSYIYNPDTVFTGATSTVNGRKGLVPTPYTTDVNKVLYGNGSWGALPQATTVIANPASSPTATLEKLQVGNTIYEVGGGGSDVSITPTFVDGVKIADYEIDGVSGILKTPVKEITQAQYDLLPSTKLTDNIVYYISGTKVLDPDYTYHTWGENDEIVVRVYHEGESDETIKWCFRNWNQTSGDMAIPSSLVTYAPTDLSPIYSANYPNGGETQDGWIGFYNDNIRAWIQSTGDTTTGRMYGVVDINGGARQTNLYEDDPYIWISSSIKKIVVNGTEYGNTSGGGGSGSTVSITPTLSSGTKIADYEIDGVSGSLYAPSGGGGSEYYLTNGLVGSSGGSYITCPLDKNMDNGFYVVVMRDGNYTYATSFIWTGSTLSMSIGGNYTFEVTSTTAGLTWWAGAWRDIYADIIKIAGF